MLEAIKCLIILITLYLLLRLLVELLLDGAKVHGVLDDVEVVRDVERDGVDGLVERPRVLVLAHGREALAAFLHERLVADGANPLNLLRLEHPVRDDVALLVALFGAVGQTVLVMVPCAIHIQLGRMGIMPSSSASTATDLALIAFCACVMVSGTAAAVEKIFSVLAHG